MNSLPALPAGWTPDRLYSSSGAEMAALPPADYALIHAYLGAESADMVASKQVSYAAAGFDRATAEDRARIAAEAGFHVEDMTNGLADVAQTMINDRLDVWGFAVLKMWGYGSGDEAETWKRFWKRWTEFMDQQLRANGARGNLRAGLAGKLRWVLVEDERLAGASISQAREIFAEMVEDEKRFPNGVDLDMCLCVGEESVRSLLNASENSVPFVVGVARQLDDCNDCYGSQGFFKIAMDTLIPDVWYLLSIMPPCQLDPGEGLIYRGILTEGDLDDDMGTYEEDHPTPE